MSLFLHELIHLLLSLLTAFTIVYVFKVKKIREKFAIFLFSILGGFFIDFDHLFDYLLAFGFRFRLDYFLRGYHFIKSDKIYIPFHSFELVFILIFIALLLKRSNKTIKQFSHFAIILSLSLSLLLHLFFDVYANEFPMKSYFFSYRLEKKFALKNLVPSAHYKNHLKAKKRLKL